jgi:lipopolysaccharide transport system ATP-binding protein
MSKKEIEKKFEEIVDFSGVEKFIDTPVKRYSSGMRVRLGFAVAAHLEPEILLIDEVLAVGDAAFQKKCLGKMGDVAREGRTVLFVSHNMSAVEGLCRSAILLDLGHKIYSGAVKDVIYFYLHNFVSEGSSGKIAPDMHKSATGELVIDKVFLSNHTGEPVSQVRMNEPFTVKIVFSVNEPVKEARMGLGFNTIEGKRIATSHHTDSGLETFSADTGVCEIIFGLTNPLLPGTYIIGVGAHRALGGHIIDFVPEALRFDVVELSSDGYVHPKYNRGLIHFNGKWQPARKIEEEKKI